MSLLHDTLLHYKHEAAAKKATIEAAAPDIIKLEQIAGSIASHGYPVTPNVFPIICPLGSYAELSITVTASPERADDLIKLLEEKGIGAESSESVTRTFEQTWRLTAHGSLPITLYISYPITPRHAEERRVAA